MPSFRDRLLATLRALEPILTETGVLVIGSEVPNLLEPDAAATLVVSQDVDVGIEVTSHAAVKRRLSELRGYAASGDEPSVWLPVDHDGLEINFVGMDSDIEDVADASKRVKRAPMIEILDRRARRARARAAVRGWEYRQRRHAKGVWVRLMRLLADASHAWAIDEAVAKDLIAEGCRLEPVGLELEPAKNLVVVPATHSGPSGAGVRPIAVNLGADFLVARYVALRRFP